MTLYLFKHRNKFTLSLGRI